MASDRAQILITAVDQTRTALDGIRNNLGRLGDETRRVQGLLAGLGVSLTLGAFAALVKGAIDSADELNKLSQKIGISVEALSTLQFAAQLSDVGLDTLKTGLKGLSANLTEARAGLGEGAALFQALGISVEDSAGNLKSSDTILLEIADRFASFEDGATKTALAVKLFGKSGMDMIPFLNQGSSGIRALMLEAERLGLKLSTETAQAAEAFNDNLTALKASTSGLGITLATELLAPLRVVTDAIREGQGEATGFAAILGGALKTTLETILVLGVNVAYVFKSMGTEIGGMAAQLSALARLDIRGFAAIGEAMREDAIKARAEVDALSARILNPPQTKPAAASSATPTAGAATEDMQRMACVLSGGEWRGGRCVKKGAEAKDNSAARLAVLKAQADAEFRLLKVGLDQQKAALDRALDDRLVSIRDYYAQKTRLEQAAIELAKRFEGFHRVPKHDPHQAHPYVCPAGYWTIGYGHLCDPKHPPITEAKAEVYLARDLQTALVATLRYCPVLATEPEGRLAAIVDFTFNLGAGRLQTSTLRRRLNQRDWEAAARELRRWVYGGGKVLPGLVTRRSAEVALLIHQ